MRTPMLTTLGGICLLCLFAIVGCNIFADKAKMFDMHKSSNFSADSLYIHSICVAGVATTIGKRHDKEVDMVDLANYLHTAFRARREGLTIYHADTVRRNMGSGAYADMMNEYESSGNVSFEALRKMNVPVQNEPPDDDLIPATVEPIVKSSETDLAYKEVRYAIFARIESDIITTRDYGKSESVDGEQIEVGRTFETRRELTMGMDIYDLAAGTRVWDSTMKIKRSVEEYYEADQLPAEDDDDKGILGWVVDKLFFGDDDEETVESLYPQPVALSQLIGAIFGDFAEHILAPPEL